MRDLILYIATSLDMYIARPDGSVDWLYNDQDYGYHEFYNNIDTTIMGHNTYKQIRSYGPPFPYRDKTNYVMTRRQHGEEGYIQFINDKTIPFVQSLKQERGKDIWLVGGGSINDVLLEAGLIDKMILSVHPILLTQGIPLFPHAQTEMYWDLVESHVYEKGLVQLKYKKKSADTL